MSEREASATASAEYLARTESVLDAVLTPEENSLYRAMRYTALGGGKRVRAFLTFTFCLAASERSGEAFDENAPAAYAAAIELMHAASLIHDDLPCMDDDDFRRGKPSSHKAFGEATAVLAGDALMLKAVEVALSNKYVTDSQNNYAARLLTRKSGADGMIGGQMMDISGDAAVTDGASLEKLQLLKTSCLISCACMLGCVAAGNDPTLTEAAELYGKYLGLAFQIRDDILDVEGDPKALGKSVGKDVAELKATYPALFGLEKSKELCLEYTELAVDSLKAFYGDKQSNAGADTLARFARELAARTH